MSHHDDAVADRKAAIPTPFGPPASAYEDPAFLAWAEAFRADAAPQGALESALIDLLITAAHRLARIAKREVDVKTGDTAHLRERSHAERAWTRALADWKRARPPASRPGRTGLPEPEPAVEPEPEAHALPQEPPEPIVLPEIADWRPYIGMNREVSILWPVILGTDITVEEVACMIVEGWSPEEIIKRYPGITPAQIAATRSCDVEFMCGPWINGVPMANPPAPPQDPGPPGRGPSTN